MSGISPNFDDWRRLSSIKVYEIAALIQGFDPRAGGDVVVQDPYDPNSPYGVPPDTSWEERALISAVETGLLLSAPVNVTEPDTHTKISVSSLLPWLRAQGYHDLAAELNTPMVTNSVQGQLAQAPPSPIVSEPARRLKALRDLGGDAKWLKMKWRFTKIKELVGQEKRAGKLRSDEKTIRKDLTEAAEAESMKRRSGPTP